MFIVERKPKSISAEAYRTLRTNIQYSSYDKKIKKILVTSSEPSEGKSTIIGNLAVSLSQSENTVIILDCDLRKPTMHKKFKISNEVGLTELLVGKKELKDVVQYRNKHLHIITSGKIPPNPAEMLASKSMERLLEQLANEYDYILMDTPPLNAVTDAQVLSTEVDGTLIVIRSEKTKKESILTAKNLLQKVNANILGIVFNDVANSINKYYYYYGEDKK
ncbi:tyrosine-protein kinase etk [Clostridium bornimense]|uniref:non-specific protein-tyrosine kinase n=1 Tax=Clostridium bornimense TaxID=1216932 RepID=W6RUG2_9CLOT|nr:CpsD/CapB family tyrosine-protein kinase [Clostridium bornimense]CDM67933.1 tyrosine-protein kinase etk [Clostridium bornimense]